MLNKIINNKAIVEITRTIQKNITFSTMDDDDAMFESINKFIFEAGW